jgi:hypothetical protein
MRVGGSVISRIKSGVIVNDVNVVLKFSHSLAVEDESDNQIFKSSTIKYFGILHFHQYS